MSRRMVSIRPSRLRTIEEMGTEESMYLRPSILDKTSAASWTRPRARSQRGLSGTLRRRMSTSRPMGNPDKYAKRQPSAKGKRRPERKVPETRDPDDDTNPEGTVDGEVYAAA